MARLFWPLTAALVACRFYQFQPHLDHPHLFRQADTAFYSLGFYRFGMNIFTPSVGWMGPYRHVVLEFPLTEWISACLYHLTAPTILVDRLVNIGFFLGSVYFLFQIVRLVQDSLMARSVVLVYMAAPLGIYYSRAVHIDFTAVCFSHALLSYAVRFVANGRRRDLVAAMLAGTLAFVIKAPYAFYLLLPALVFCHRRKARLETWLLVGVAFAVPAAAFILWFGYSQAVNRRAPDLSFIPSYFSHADRFEWYFGTLAARLTLEPWHTVAGRVFREIATTVWWALVPFAWLALERLRPYWSFAVAWGAGTLIYLMLFTGLNAMHNYYQIPFIAPFSLGLGAAVYLLWTAPHRWARIGRVAAAAVLIGYAASSFWVATRRFYRTDPVHLAVGRTVKGVTSDDDLVVMAYTIAAWADPSFLFYARRYGWSVGHQELSPSVIDRLVDLGATAIVTSTTWPPSDPTRIHLERMPLVAVRPIGGGDVSVRRLTRPGTPP
jgi:4-amino-4-deoxy-L-arabinose transferase-like glycosyltransferase